MKTKVAGIYMGYVGLLLILGEKAQPIWLLWQLNCLVLMCVPELRETHHTDMMLATRNTTVNVLSDNNR